MADLKGKKVLITGAASGIGFCLAEECAKARMILILTDINGPKLAEALLKLRNNGATVYVRQMDASKQENIWGLVREVEEDLGGLDVLVNNAGIGFLGELAETPLYDWKRLIDINLWGPLYHTYAFLPGMIKRGKGQIVNVSSGQAFFRLPTWGAYAAVKLALGAFSELLAVETRKYGIKVTTVYPFMVNTGFYGNIKGETFMSKLSMRLVPYYSMTPQSVAKIIFRAIENGKRVEMVSAINYIGYYARLIPPVADAISYIANLLLAKKAKK